MTRRAATVALLLLSSAAGRQAQPQAPPRSRAECEAAHPVASGRPGKDVIWLPTYDAVVTAMLQVAKVTSRDLVFDLGAGDGKIAIAAAKEPYRARAVGIEYDPELAKLATCLVEVEGLEDRVKIVQGDIFKEDFRDASVVTMYLLPNLNLCVRHRLLAMEPGTRVVSHQFDLGDWKPDESMKVMERNVGLWVVPARVDGVWDFKDGKGPPFTVDLHQTFGVLSGEITLGGGVPQPLSAATLRGRELHFTFDSAGTAHKFSGSVRGGEIAGELLAATAAARTKARTTVGRLRGYLRSSPWAEMLPDCDRYYER